MKRSELLKTIDNAWLLCGCNRFLPLSMQTKKVRQFYSHQCWLDNASFSELDPASILHRKAIRDYIFLNRYDSILDYGGGSKASLLKSICQSSDYKASLALYEPYVDQDVLPGLLNLGIKVFRANEELTVFRVIVCKDVLEHVDNPLRITHDLKKALAPNGVILMGNSFDNTIKCHLPKHFHLRYTFWLYMYLMGFRRGEPLQDCRGVVPYKNISRSLPYGIIIMVICILFIPGNIVYLFASVRRRLRFLR